MGIIIEGKNVNAKVFTNKVEDTAIKQIYNMASHDITKGTQLRIMPDVHAGKGSTIGTTIKLPKNFEDWKVCPNVVGVDVGCGILMYKLSNKDINLDKLDRVINERVPSGFNQHDSPLKQDLTDKYINELTFKIEGKLVDRVHNSLGTLGGGNHFIELGIDEDGAYWLSVHSGSRNLGVQVADFHQNAAIDKLADNKVDIESIIKKLKAQGKHSEIQSTIKSIKENTPEIDNEAKMLAFLTGDLLKRYLNDMTIAQEYAVSSRSSMLDIICEAMGFDVIDKFDSAHNFIEHNGFTGGIVRKGATSAKRGERLVIPLNMRDGSLICVGKGNEDWNNSAPHGAGRLMSRTKARNEINMEDFRAQMSDVFSSSVTESTIDEAPDAYKPAEEIIAHIEPTATILHLVKPIYNFKSH